MFKKVDKQDIIEEELPDGSLKRYIKGKLLGKGGFAKCYEFTSLQTQKKYAAKVIDKASLQKSKAKQKLSSEIKIHKSLVNPYVVKFEHFFEDSEYVYILLQKCSNQTLNEILKRRKRLTDIETKYYIYQLSVALKYIHEEMVIHRDLKLGNLFLSDKLQIKIGDFGLAAKLQNLKQKRKTKCGTPNYIAPQILDDSKSHSFEVDIWSLGVITFTLLVGYPPFQCNDLTTTYNRIKTCNYIFPESSNLSEVSKNFISKLLQLDPSKRPTVQEILHDPFLNENSIPQSLPLSTLACPPSLDFLKKYRDAEITMKAEKSMNGSSFLNTSHDQQKSFNKLPARQKSMKNSTSKLKGVGVENKQKQQTLNRVFSAANIHSNRKFKPTSNKTNANNEYEKQSLKIWVTYYQQNAKFGLGYLLNSNAAGFRYNDATCMITNSKKTHLLYSQWDKKHDESKDEILGYDVAKEAQNKKFKILAHFDRELHRIKQEKEKTMPNSMRIKQEKLKFRENQETQMKFYVTRYHITNKSLIFWFNVAAYQVIFQDGSQMLFSQNKVVTYVNKFGERIYFHDKNRQKQSQQVKKRLRHLLTVINNRIPKKNQQNTSNSNVEQPSLSKTKVSSNSLAKGAPTQTQHLKKTKSNKTLALHN